MEIKIYNPLKLHSPFNLNKIYLGKFFRYNSWTSGIERNPFFTYGTYGHDYRCWKQNMSFEYRGYYSYRIPLFVCLHLIWKYRKR